MRKIDKLLSHAIIPPFLIAFAVLTFVVCIHEIGTLSELLITRNASPSVVLTIALAILPGIFMFSLPLSFLIGILIGLGGLSGESQITALRACGVPLRSLLRFIMSLGIIVGLLTAIISLVILPKTNDILRSVKEKISLKQATSQIQPRVFNEDFPDKVFYLDDLSIDKQSWSRIFLSDNSNSKFPRIMIAHSGSWITDPDSRRIQLHLEKGSSYEIKADEPGKDSVSHFTKTDIPLKLDSRFSSSDENVASRQKNIGERDSLQLWKQARDVPPEKRLDLMIELHRRMALPFSVFPFALLGLSLAACMPKGGRTSGFALSLATVIVFYILFFNGLRLASVGKISPWLGAWGSNILLASLGLLLFSKVEKSHVLSHWISRIFHFSLWENIKRNPRIEKMRTGILLLDYSILRSTSRLSRYRFPRILDLYISKGFFIYFFWSLITCGTLFILFTLFDLLDDIIRNEIVAVTVADYFTFLMPQILMLVIPMSVLLAILINFGILEKNSEITAIKAGGWSLYRVAVPVFLIASGLCVGLFLIQDYVLPYANIRQDAIRNEIKGSPPQTTKYLQRKWIFGKSSRIPNFDRIYNYEYFDENQDSFVGLHVYDVDMNKVRILRWIYATRARIEAGGSWILENGWVRDYSSGKVGFRIIKSGAFQFPEKAAYFEREIFQPKESSKFTYPALKNYINYLTQSGYNATELQVELNKKISFPLSCLVMALLGVPFSFSTGKKGAFFGIGVSIAIAMSYWGVSGIFEALGTYGLLVPILAAWAPNIVFSAAGLVLLFTIRT
jgi:LPS export ABC transporter permease LptG/LPS export ABC transporter permease LptF